MKRIVRALLCLLLCAVSLVAVISAATYTGDYMAVVNTNLSTESLYEGTMSSEQEFLSSEEEMENGAEVIAYDVYIDEETGEELRILSPELEEPVWLEDAPKTDVSASVQEAPAPESAYSVNQTRTIIDSHTNTSKTVKCLYVGTYCTVWGSTTENSSIRLTSSIARTIGQKFDQYCTTETNMFGTWYDVDYDGKVAILCHDIESNYGSSVSSYVAGYFHSANMINAMGKINGISFASSNYAMNMDCIHIDTYPGMGSALDDVSRSYSTLFHEFQHMIQFSYRVKDGTYKNGMPTYLNEACSMAAEHLICGSSTTASRISYFNDNSSYSPGYPLTYWTGSLSNYANSYLFGQYLRTRYARLGNGDGSTIYRRVLETMSSAGGDAIDIFAQKLNTTPTQLVKDFWAAIICNKSSGIHGFNGESWSDALNPLVITSWSSYAGIYNGGAKIYRLNGSSATVSSKNNVEVFCIKDGSVVQTVSDRKPYLDMPSGVDVTLTDNTYPWEYTGGQFQSSNQGVSSSTSTLTLSFTTTRGSTLTFDYGVSSESGYDKLTITVDSTTIANAISGTTTGNCNRELAAGSHTVTFSYQKDGSLNSNSDIGWFRNFKLELEDNRGDYLEVPSDVNVTLTDDTYPWEYTGGKFCSTNAGVSSSASTLTMNFTTTRSGTLTFDYGVSSESNYDKLTITVDSTTVANAISGSTTGSCNQTLAAGSHTVKFVYQKDGSLNSGSDLGWFQNFKLAYSAATSGTCGTNLSWSFNTSTGKLTISGTGAMTDYSYSSPSPWRENFKDQVTSVSIGGGATTIGKYAFYDCANLQTVSFPSSIQTIRPFAFYDCDALTAATLSGSLTTIEEDAFGSCENLRSVSLGSNVTSIGEYAFEFAPLTELVLPEKLTTITKGMCYGCTYLKQVTIPISVTSIEEGAFNYCGALTDVYYGGKQSQWGAITIGSNNTSLTNATIHCQEEESDLLDRINACLPSSLVSYVSVADDDYPWIWNNGRFESASQGVDNSNSDLNLVFKTKKACTLSFNYGVSSETNYDKLSIVKGGNTVVNGISGTASGSYEAQLSAGETVTLVFSYTKDVSASDRSDLAWISDLTLTADETFALTGSNMTLGNELRMNILGKKSDMTNGPYKAVITHGSKQTEVTFTEYNSSYYGVSYAVAAKQMADTITVDVYDGDGNLVSEDYQTSVRDYAMRVLDNSAMATAVKKVVVDMLNYGAAAQTYFSYNASDLANKSLTTAQKALATGSVTCTNRQIKGANFYGAGLALENKILLNLYFQNVTSGMYARVNYTDYNGNSVSVYMPFSEFSRYTGSIYKLVVDDIVLADAFQPVKVTVYNANGTVHGSVTDSVESYIARTGSSAINTAIIKFAYSSKAYLGG